MSAERLIAFLQTDCPTCQLIAPYLDRLARAGVAITGISQNSEAETREFVTRMGVTFPVEIDVDLRQTRQFDPVFVPTLLVVDTEGRVARSEAGFDKAALNEIAVAFGRSPVASPDDGAPGSKPGCTSRHRERSGDGPAAATVDLY